MLAAIFVFIFSLSLIRFLHFRHFRFLRFRLLLRHAAADTADAISPLFFAFARRRFHYAAILLRRSFDIHRFSIFCFVSRVIFQPACFSPRCLRRLSSAAFLFAALFLLRLAAADIASADIIISLPPSDDSIRF